MHSNGIIIILPSSKYASPIFDHRKPNGKLRLLVDLKKINNFISDAYRYSSHPVSTLSHEANPLTGKTIFCKLDSSHVFRCLKMVDQRSIQMSAFSFVSRTIAYNWLAQALSWSVLPLFQIITWELRPSCHSWPMCSIRGWF